MACPMVRMAAMVPVAYAATRHTATKRPPRQGRSIAPTTIENATTCHMAPHIDHHDKDSSGVFRVIEFNTNFRRHTDASNACEFHAAIGLS
jgi:hypothetical protein